MRFPLEIILVCIRWYYAYPLSLRHLEEMMEERGAFLDHSTVGRWAVKFGLALEKIFRRYKSPVRRGVGALESKQGQMLRLWATESMIYAPCQTNTTHPKDTVFPR